MLPNIYYFCSKLINTTMKKFYLATTLLVLFLSSSAMWAGDGKDSLKTEVDPYPSFKGFVTNKFWDNWEISLGFGTGFAVYSNNNYGTFGDRFGLNGDFWVAKWLNPVVGVRAGLMGGNYNTVHPSYGKTSWPFLFGHVDAMANISNWIGGYKEDRVYYAVLFAGMGLMGTNFTDASKAATGTSSRAINYAFTAGLLNKFRVSPSVDINLELRGILGMAGLNPVASPARGRYLGTANASVGVTYRFGKRDFQRGAAGYTLEDVKALEREAKEAAVAAKEKEDNLESQLDNARKNAATAQQRADQAEKELAKANEELEALRNQEALDASTPEDMVFFDFGMAVLTSEDQIRLTVLATNINNGPKDYVYTVTGYADMKTGERAKNIALAEKRAKVVYDYLVKLGVPEAQLTYTGAGDEQPFNSNGNQVVIIK